MARMTPWADRALRLASRLSGVSGAVAVVALAVTLVVVGWPVLESAGHYQFFSGTGWFPQWTAFDEPAIYGSLSFLFGTLMTAFLGLVAAFPLAFATGLWLGASAGPRQRRFAIEWLGFASTWPALAFGACGLLLVAPVLSKFFGLPRQGYALAGIVLALMHLPSMALRIAFALRDVPDTLRDDAALLGATGWQVLWRLVIPAAWPGIATAIVLAAIGLAG